MLRKDLSTNLFAHWAHEDPNYGQSPSSAEAFQNSYRAYNCGFGGVIDDKALDLGFTLLHMILKPHIRGVGRIALDDVILSRMNLNGSAGEGYDGTKRAVLVSTDFSVLTQLKDEFNEFDPTEHLALYRIFPKMEQLKAHKLGTAERTIANCPWFLGHASQRYLQPMFDDLMLAQDQIPFCVGSGVWNGGLRSLFMRHDAYHHHYSIDYHALEHSFDSQKRQRLAFLWGDLSGHKRQAYKLMAACDTWVAIDQEGRMTLTRGKEPSGSGTTIMDNTAVCTAAVLSYLATQFTELDISEFVIHGNSGFILDVLGDDVFLSTNKPLDMSAFQYHQLNKLGLVATIEEESTNIHDHFFLGMKIDESGRIRTSRIGKMFNKLLKAGPMPEYNYAVASGIRNVIYHHKREFALLGRFLDWLQTTYDLPNSRTPEYKLRQLYA